MVRKRIAFAMFLVMALCAIPCILFVPYAIMGAFVLDSFAITILIIGVIGVLLSKFYFQYSRSLNYPTFRSPDRKKVLFYWGMATIAHLAILSLLNLFINKIGCLPFHPISAFFGYILMILPIPIVLACLSLLIFIIEFLRKAEPITAKDSQH